MTQYTCPGCSITTSNLNRHALVCTAPYSTTAGRLRLLAGLHGATPETLAPEARFANGVTDLAVARLLYALEGGTLVLQRGDSWTAPFAPRLLYSALPAVAREAVRTGLAVPALAVAGRHSWPVLAPGPVHLRAAASLSRPACGDVAALRHRLIGGGYSDMVTCEACLDAPLAAVSYSTDE